MRAEWAIALDGGTTHTRARLLRAGRVIATARQPVGVRDAVIGSGAPALPAAIHEALAELRAAVPRARPAWIAAAGMLTSEVGLLAVPHAPAPAGLDDLARGVIERAFPAVTDLPIRLIPGVRTPPGPGPDGWSKADIMRGEECETLGALEAQRSAARDDPAVSPAALPCAFLWPGSHTKLVIVDGAGRIERSHTSLAGEMLEALGRHTLLAASLPPAWPDRLDDEAVAAGTLLAQREGLGRAAFLVRISHLAGRWEPDQRAAFLIGAVVAEDALHLQAHLPPTPLWVGGRGPLRGLYQALLSRTHSAPVTALEPDVTEAASALGALAIATRFEELGLAARKNA